MAIKIITDSACDITQEEAKAFDICVIPLKLTIDGEEYEDGINLSHKEFYEKLPLCKELPKTSQITPVVYDQYIQQEMKEGDSVIIITLSSKLSGTCQSANIAASEYEGRAFVVDSENATGGQRILVEYAVQLREKGMAVEDMVAELDRAKKKIRLIGLLDTLEYLRKGGRISAVTALAGELLSIKPVVEVVDGEVVQKGKARGSRKGNNLLREMIEGGNGVDFEKPYVLAYSGLSDELLNRYVEDSGDLWKQQTDQLPAINVGVVIGTHVGPGAIAVCYFEK